MWFVPQSESLRTIAGVIRVLESARDLDLAATFASDPRLAGDIAEGVVGDLARASKEYCDDSAAALLDAYRAAIIAWREGSTRPAPWPRANAINVLNSCSITSVVVRGSRLVAPDDTFLQVGAQSALDDLVGEWCAIVAGPDFDRIPESWRLDALNTAGNCLLLRFDVSRSSEDFDAAETLWKRALRESPAGWPNRAKYLHNLAQAAFIRARTTSSSSDLEAAIAHARECVRADPSQILFVTYYGIILLEQYLRAGALAALDEAIGVLESAMRLGVTLLGRGERSPHVATAFNQLGSALRNRYLRTRNLADLDRAVSLSRRAVELTSSGDQGAPGQPAVDSSALPVRLTNYGNTLIERAAVPGSTRADADLTEALAACTRAVDLSTEDDPQFPARLNNLGNCHRRRAERSGRPEPLDAAIAVYRRALALTPPGAPDLTSRQYNLANSLRDRWGLAGSALDLDDGRTAYRNACLSGRQRDVPWAFFAARNWGDWASSRGEWGEAAEAYANGHEMIEALVSTQFSRRNKETWLSELQQFSSRSAYASAIAGDARAAALALERGRASLLTESLQLQEIGVERLRDLGHAALAEQYERSLAEWNQASYGDTQERVAAPAAERLRAARQAFDSVLAAIRVVPGYERFAAQTTIDDLFAAAGLSPLVYVTSAQREGLAIIVTHETRPDVVVVRLPLLTDAALAEAANGYGLAMRDRDAEPDGWVRALEETTEWLWHAVVGPICDHVAHLKRITVIPCGPLAWLPLHGASTRKGDQPTYATDALTIAYSPNARSLVVAAGLRAAAAEDNLLVVSAPRPSSQPPLPFARHESKAIQSMFARRRVLHGARADKSTVSVLLPSCSVVHIACHGLVDPREPLSAGLVMARDELLTLREILRFRLPMTQLVVLSACDTAVPGERLPDEVVSLATGFFQAGADGVVASLWAVPDESTMLLMARFYHYWRVERLEPADALRAAQQWMRTAPDRAKAADLKGVIPSSLYDDLMQSPDGTTRYARLEQWAAFTFTGIPGRPHGDGRAP